MLASQRGRGLAVWLHQKVVKTATKLHKHSLGGCTVTLPLARCIVSLCDTLFVNLQL